MKKSIIKLLEWDSSFFNKKIGELELVDSNQRISNVNDFDLIYVKQREDEEVYFEENNFRLSHLEAKVIFSKIIAVTNTFENECIISALEKSDFKNQLYELAFESGKYSRFNLDGNFQRSEFESLYRKWVDNSLSNEFADEVLLYKQENVILGIVTYKVFDNFATIGLLAINPESQGKGIGSKLVESVENKLSAKGIKELRIPTQLQNIPACHFYTKLGYSINEKLIIKHYWRI